MLEMTSPAPPGGDHAPELLQAQRGAEQVDGENGRWLQEHDRGLTEIINNPHLGAQHADKARHEFGPLLHSLVDRARRHGALRSDFAASDVVFLHTCPPQ